jgi:hypothetical protein
MIVWTRSAVNDLDALRTIAELDPRSRGARRVIEAVSLLETTATWAARAGSKARASWC